MRLPIILYPLRLETTSPLYGAGYDGQNYGATIIKRYGLDGTFYGDAGYNALTTTDLWPYPNEADIKTDMTADSTRGFCASGQTLTKYIWEYLGNTIPDDIYGEKPVVLPPTVLHNPQTESSL